MSVTKTSLRIAYSAVKAQITRANMHDLWLDDSQRALFEKAELELRDALIAETLAAEIASRGGEKVRSISKESIMTA